MRKLLFALICMCVFVFQGNAQMAVDQDLKMTELQKEAFLQIQKDRSDQMKAITELRKQDMTAYQAKAAIIVKQSNDRLKSLLNEKQWEVYSRMQKQANTIVSPKISG